MVLEYVALGVTICVVLILFYGIIAIHDIPYEIAKERQHPHQDAIHVAGWLSLFTLHALWPLLWIWATIYRPERGWGMVAESNAKSESDTQQLEQRLTQLEAQIALLTQTKSEE